MDHQFRLVSGRFLVGLFVFVLLVGFLSGPVWAQSETGEKTRGDYLTLKVAVMGPGDQLYFWWGHIALIIEDSFTGQKRFYDYGLFSFDTENFFLNFALGRLLYSCGVSPMDANLNVYLRTNRDITLYTLDLPPAKREEVWRFAETNVLPENRDYYYHHFKDNCSTRIRDIVDLATSGQFKEDFGETPGRFTLRQHVRRHTWFAPFSDWLLCFLMGQDIDTQITIWEEMFLPAEVGSRISDYRYTDDDGLERQLVSGVEIVNRAVKRPAVLDFPPRQWGRALIVGLFIAALLIVLKILRAKGSRPGEALFGIAQAALGLFFGIAGIVLFFMTFFTNHDYTFHNINVLFINPLVFAALPLGILYAAAPGPVKRLRRGRLLAYLWTYVFVAGIITMVIKVLPFFYQQNQVTQALVLPFALVLSVIPEKALLLYRRIIRK
ncbi:membrane protein [Spirochaetia bacterium]|nr:membrane protein [Spirochaetia bacterium]